MKSLTGSVFTAISKLNLLPSWIFTRRGISIIGEKGIASFEIVQKPIAAATLRSLNHFPPLNRHATRSKGCHQRAITGSVVTQAEKWAGKKSPPLTPGNLTTIELIGKAPMPKNQRWQNAANLCLFDLQSNHDAFRRLTIDQPGLSARGAKSLHLDSRGHHLGINYTDKLMVT